MKSIWEEKSSLVSLTCTGCGAVIDVDKGHRTAVCIYCQTPGVVESPLSGNVSKAEFVLPFLVGREAALAGMRDWIKTRGIFCPNGVKTASLESTEGVYVPSYLYSCVANSRYQAQIGEDYTESETCLTTSNGKSVARTRTVTKTEWRDLAGVHARYISDVVVTASKGIPNAELEAIEPFDLRKLYRMEPAVLSGWVAEEPSLNLEGCFEMARQEALFSVGLALREFMPGDSHRNLTHTTLFDREGADLVLVPVWVLSVRWHSLKPALRILINGQTGKIGGTAPTSPVKVTVAVLSALLLIISVALVWHFSQRGGG